jgi:hypothetical protein
MNLEPILSATARRFAWISTSISGSRRSNRRFAARLTKATRVARKIYPPIAWQEASCGHQAVGRPRRLSSDVRSWTFAEDGPRCSLGPECRVQAGTAVGNDSGSADQGTEAAPDPKARNASLQCGRGEDVLEVRITHDVRNSFRRCDHDRHAPKRMHLPQVAGHRLGARNRQHKRTLRKGPTGQWENGETKRAGSRRLIRLQNWVLARLKQLREFQTAHPVVDPEEWPEAVDLIFVTEFGRPVNVNSLVYKHFKPILKRAGLPNLRLYDLRHTAATLALTVGVSPKVVSEQLGHTSAAFTLDVYSHVLPHMQDDAAAKVEAALMGGF